jgi:hypothetical protein
MIQCAEHLSSSMASPWTRSAASVELGRVTQRSSPVLAALDPAAALGPGPLHVDAATTPVDVPPRERGGFSHRSPPPSQTSKKAKQRGLKEEP